MTTLSFTGTNPITRRGVESLNPVVKITDNNDNLTVFCYTECSSDSPDDVKRCRGVVFDGDTLVMNSFPYSDELPLNETEIDEKIEVSSCSFFKAHEGTLLRVFNHDSKWYTSTHRKLLSSKSKWASKVSFGKYFDTGLKEIFTRLNKTEFLTEDGTQKFLETLCPHMQYMFLVKSQDDNVIVSPSSYPPVLLVGTFINHQLTLDETIPNFPRPEPLSITTSKDLVDLITTMHEKEDKTTQGVIVFAPNNTQYKLINPTYKTWSDIRGNEPSIKFRYLQLLTRDDYEVSIPRLKALYPHYESKFEDYDVLLHQIGVNIYESYINRYIHKHHVVVAQNLFTVMKMCHAWHCENRQTNRINIDRVMEFLFTQSATSLNHMIKDLLTPPSDES